MVFETRPCAFCGNLAHYENGSLGTLLGPILDRKTGEEYWTHRLCALWSPEVYQTDAGTLCQILASIKRSKAIRCSECQGRGASIGCRVETCKHSYHLSCAGKAGCLFNVTSYMLACPKHARLFRHEKQVSRQGGDDESPAADAQPVAGRKRKVQAQNEHIRAAVAASKQARLENSGRQAESSDDEEHFRRKEVTRLERDRAKLNPVILGRRRGREAGVMCDTGVEGVEYKAGWEAVGGLSHVVKQLKEMVLLPLVYPELFGAMGVQPPRGILFHGEPGTGKTLVARSLAGACAQHSPTPVAFFARKGADCLGKFAGEAERTLRLLFEEAAARAPSIIFLDELDGLVPTRASQEGSSDQIYASVVSTMLALMDGVADRGAVVVIGATNRPDSIDPALRRPGRFDREVYFGLPTKQDRAAILKVQTDKWEVKPSSAMLDGLAGATEGFAGADLQALCASAVVACAVRSEPHLMDHLSERAATAGPQPGDGSILRPDKQRLMQPMQVKACDWRVALNKAPAPCSQRQAAAALEAHVAAPLPHHAAPLLLPPLQAALNALNSASLPLPPLAAAAVKTGGPGQEQRLADLGVVLRLQSGLPRPTTQPDSREAEQLWDTEPPHKTAHQCCRILVAGQGDLGQARVAGALLFLLEGCPLHTLSLPALIMAGQGDACKGVVAAVQSAIQKAQPSSPCVFYLPRIDSWAVNVQPLDSAVGDDSPDGAAVAGASPSEMFPVSAARKRPSPIKTCATSASPFRGLMSLEERGHSSPSGVWSANAPAKEGATPRAAAKHPSPFARGAEHLAIPPTADGASPPAAVQGQASYCAEHTPTPPHQGADSRGGGEQYEAVVLAEVWQMFEQLIKEVPPSQPLILVATSDTLPGDLPPLLSAFFGGQPATSASGEAPIPQAPATVAGGGGQRIVEVVPGGGAGLEQSFGRSVGAAAEMLAREGIALLRDALQAKRLTRHRREQKEDQMLRPNWEEEEQQDGSEVAEREARLHQGSTIFRQVAKAVQAYGSRLLKDPRTRLVKPGPPTAPRTRAARQPTTNASSLREVARRAAAGLLFMRGEFLQQAGAAITAARVSGSMQLAYSARAAAGSALHDELLCWDGDLVARLRLSEPQRKEALAAAEGAVASHLQQARQRAQELQQAQQAQDHGDEDAALHGKEREPAEEPQVAGESTAVESQGKEQGGSLEPADPVDAHSLPVDPGDAPADVPPEAMDPVHAPTVAPPEPTDLKNVHLGPAHPADVPPVPADAANAPLEDAAAGPSVRDPSSAIGGSAGVPEAVCRLRSMIQDDVRAALGRAYSRGRVWATGGMTLPAVEDTLRSLVAACTTAMAASLPEGGLTPQEQHEPDSGSSDAEPHVEALADAASACLAGFCTASQ